MQCPTLHRLIEDKIEECEQTLKRIPGFALGTPIEEVATLEDCYKECEKNPDCHAIVYSAKVSRCFLKVNGYEPPVAETVEGRDSTTIEMCCMNPESAKYCSIDGGWSEFGPWSECSKSCGGGMWSKERACDNPTPKHEGKDCVGEATEFGQCNVQPCIDS